MSLQANLFEELILKNEFGYFCSPMDRGVAPSEFDLVLESAGPLETLL